MVCSTENIVTFLTSSPRALDESQMTDIAEALSVSLQAAGARLPPPAATLRRRRAARHRRPESRHADRKRLPRAPLPAAGAHGRH